MNDRSKAMQVNEENAPVSVPYVVYRDAVSDKQWVIKKLIYALIAAVALMFISNVVWLLVWNSYDFQADETVVESSENGVANYTGGNGGISYGEGYSPQGDTNEAQGQQGNESP